MSGHTATPWAVDPIEKDSVTSNGTMDEPLRGFWDIYRPLPEELTRELRK